jgi:hypothetical protein
MTELAWLHERHNFTRHQAALTTSDIALDVLNEPNEDDFKELCLSLGDRILTQ